MNLLLVEEQTIVGVESIKDFTESSLVYEFDHELITTLLNFKDETTVTIEKYNTYDVDVDYVYIVKFEYEHEAILKLAEKLIEHFPAFIIFKSTGTTLNFRFMDGYKTKDLILFGIARELDNEIVKTVYGLEMFGETEASSFEGLIEEIDNAMKLIEATEFEDKMYELYNHYSDDNKVCEGFTDREYWKNLFHNTKVAVITYMNTSISK